jgi:hypothetical protein
MKKARLTSAGHLVELEFLQAFFFNKKYTLEESYSHDEDTETTQSGCCSWGTVLKWEQVGRLCFQGYAQQGGRDWLKVPH